MKRWDSGDLGCNLVLLAGLSTLPTISTVHEKPQLLLLLPDPPSIMINMASIRCVGSISARFTFITRPDFSFGSESEIRRESFQISPIISTTNIITFPDSR